MSTTHCPAVVPTFMTESHTSASCLDASLMPSTGRTAKLSRWALITSSILGSRMRDLISVNSSCPSNGALRGNRSQVRSRNKRATVTVRAPETSDSELKRSPNDVTRPKLKTWNISRSAQYFWETNYSHVKYNVLNILTYNSNISDNFFIGGVVPLTCNK